MNLQMTLFEDQKRVEKKTNRLDIVGQKFGHLRVLKFNKVRGNYTYWDCECDCGNLRTIKGADLKNNTITSCGCLRKKHIFNKTETWETRAIGKKFNNLTVIEYIGKNKMGDYLFNCECDCGNLATADIKNLRSGNKKSCGCGLQKFRENGTTKLDMTGKEFGYLTAIEPSGKSRAGDIIWRCQCVCGNEVFKKASNLKHHSTTLHCGCQKVVKEIKEKIIRKPMDREQYAKDVYCCYVMDQKMTTRDLSRVEGWKNSTSILHLFAKYIPGYKEASEKRRAESKHNKLEIESDKRSAIFRYEADFQQHCERLLKLHNVYCEINNITITGHEIDIVTTDTCFELKISTKKKDLFTAIGQLLSNALLSNRNPILLIPSDIKVSKNMAALYDLHNIEIYSEHDLIDYCERY